MKRELLTAAAIAATLVISACASHPDLATVLADTQSAIGTPATLQYSGSGNNGNFGQALAAGEPWPMRSITHYTRTINYQQRSSEESFDFGEAVFGGQHQDQLVNHDAAWNIAETGPVAQPGTSEERQLGIWLTPHGFVQGALETSTNANAVNAKLLPLPADGSGFDISFIALEKYLVSGHINNDHLVTRVETHFPNPVLGDMVVAANYSDYQDFEGTKFPTHIVIEQGGFPVWDLKIDQVTPLAPADFPIPEHVRNAAVPRTVVVSTELVPGVWHLTGGSHHSLVVRFDDFITVVEAPLNDARSLAVITEAKKLVPGKPIRYVVNTHHHFDHAGGLRTYVSEGATIVTHASNVAYYTKAFQAPAVLAPDTQATTPGMPMFQAVKDKYVISGGPQPVEVYATEGDTHTKELLIAYLPASGILVEADSYSPQDPAAQPDPTPPNALSLFDNIERLGLNVRTIAPIHGRGAVPFAEFRHFLRK